MIRSVRLTRQEKLLDLQLRLYKKNYGNRTANRHWWIGVNALKRTSDALLRNSANSPRKLARRGAMRRQIFSGGDHSGTE